jgi:prepilin-type N-terminal cleavage/methylation domain-containing protein
MMNPKKKPYYSPSSSQAGFTLIESLMAILVVTIMMIAISPAIVLSVATRVQTKRLEMGTNAARAYIAAVSSGGILNSSDQTAPPPPITNVATPNEVPVPSGGTLDCPAPPGDYLVPPGPPKFFKCDTETTDYFLYCADNDDTRRCEADSTKDIIVQGFGISQAVDTSLTPAQNAEKSYQLGVRVYRADAFKDSDPLKKSSSDPRIKAEAKTVTSGLGDRKAPLVEMTTEITTDKTTFSNLCKRLDDPGNTNSGCS